MWWMKHVEYYYHSFALTNHTLRMILKKITNLYL